MRVKSDKQLSPKNHTPRHIGVLVSLAFILIFYVAQHLSIVSLGEDIKNQESSLDELLDQKDILLSKVSELESPGSITSKLASMNLNFQYPDKVKVLRLQ